MRSQGENPLLTRRISRRSFAAGTLASGAMLAAGIARASTVAAASFGPGDQVLTTDYVNYRDAPGLNSNVYVVLPPNTMATVQDSGTDKDGYTWYLVRTATGGPSPTGYIAGNFLAYNGGGGGGNFSVGDAVYVNSGPLNMRQDPGLNGTILRTLPTGQTATISADASSVDGYVWYQIALPSGEFGWVVQDFLSLGNGGGGGGGDFPVGSQIIVNTDALNVRDQPNGAVINVVNNGAIGDVMQAGVSAGSYTWINVAFPKLQGWVATAFVQAYSGGGGGGGNFSVGDAVYVNSGPLNMRQDPGLNGTILRTLPTGTTGQVTADASNVDGYVWYQIQISSGEFGWVVQDFLSAGGGGGGGSVKVGDTIKVVDGPLNIRSAPGSNSPVIDVAATGAIATVVDGPQYGQDYTWIKINGNLLAAGWVAFEFCTVVS